MTIDTSALQALPEVTGGGLLPGEDVDVWCLLPTCLVTRGAVSRTVVVIYAKQP